jgi:hypothetical protein
MTRDYVGELAELRARGIYDRGVKLTAAGIALAALQDDIEAQVTMPSARAAPIIRGAAGILSEYEGVPPWAVLGTSCEHSRSYMCFPCLEAWTAEMCPAPEIDYSRDE